jgi:ureidoacrylate peracid hydrolase
MLLDRLRPGRTALVVIDVQNDFCHVDGVLGKRGIDLTAIHTMARRLDRFIAALRALPLSILYTKTLHDAWTDSPAWKQRQESDTVSLCRTGSWGAEFYAVAPQPDERIVVKHRYSAFTGTDLDMILRARGIETLLLTGVATNVCVETTARDGFGLGYQLVMVADCLAGTSDDEHLASLRTLERFFDAFRMDSGDVPATLAAARD